MEDVDSGFVSERPPRTVGLASRVAADRGLLRSPTIAGVGRRLLGRVRYQKLRMYAHLWYWPRIREPRTFNEKVAHRMLFGDPEQFMQLHDKLRARQFVVDRVGAKVLPDVYHVTTDPGTIPFGSLPDSFVVKSTLGSGDVVLVDDGGSEEALRAACESWLSKDYYAELVLVGGNYCYESFEPRVLLEERLAGARGDVPLDFKFYVFDGHVEYVHVDFDRFGDRSMRFFDRSFEPQSFRKGGNPLGPAIDPPRQYERMVEVAEALAEGFDFLRVDLYHTADERVVVGELTVGPGNGLSPFSPQEVDVEFGRLW